MCVLSTGVFFLGRLFLSRTQRVLGVASPWRIPLDRVIPNNIEHYLRTMACLSIHYSVTTSGSKYIHFRV